MASSQRTCTLACNLDGANGRHLPCSHFQACLKLECSHRATLLWFPIYSMLPLGFFLQPLLAFPAWQSDFVGTEEGRVRIWLLSLCLPPASFSPCFFSHFRWSNTFYLTSDEVLHSAGLALLFFCTANPFSQVVVTNKCAMAKESSWVCRVQVVGVEHQSMFSVFKWEVLRVVLFLKNKHITGTKPAWPHFQYWQLCCLKPLHFHAMKEKMFSQSSMSCHPLPFLSLFFP